MKIKNSILIIASLLIALIMFRGMEADLNVLQNQLTSFRFYLKVIISILFGFLSAYLIVRNRHN